MSDPSTTHAGFDDSNINPSLQSSTSARAGSALAGYRNPAEAVAARNQERSNRQQGLYSVSSSNQQNHPQQFYDRPSGQAVWPSPQGTSQHDSWQQQTSNAHNTDYHHSQQRRCHVYNARGDLPDQQQFNQGFGHAPNQSEYAQPDLNPIGSGNLHLQPVNTVDRAPQDPDLLARPQYEDPGQDFQRLDDINWNEFAADMDWDNLNIGMSAFMAEDMLDDTPAEQRHDPWQGEPYFVDQNAPSFMRSSEDIPGPSNIDPRLLDTSLTGPRSETAISPEPNERFHYSPRPTTRRPRTQNPERATSTASAIENPRCIQCGKRYRTTTSPGRCNRCGIKHERAIAEPFTYTLAPTIADLNAAKRLIYPPMAGRSIQCDDFNSLHVLQREDEYLQRLLDAVNVVQCPDNDADDWKIRQQKTFNEKAKLEAGYRNDQVTARLRALFWEAVMFHKGGDESVYAVGGDNSGYSENLKFTFSERFDVICEVLQTNKRVVMDVVEGRGVQGFVSNPRKYDDRKASNNFCNVKKKMMMDKGKEIEGGEEGVEAAPSRKRRQATARQDSPDSDVVESIEVGPAKRPRRTLRQSTGLTFPVESPGMADDDEGSVYSPDEPEAQAPDMVYGSGRSRTANWIHGRRGGR